MRGSVRGPELAGERRTSGQTRGLQGLHARAFRPGSARAQAIGAGLAGRIEAQAANSRFARCVSRRPARLWGIPTSRGGWLPGWRARDPWVVVLVMSAVIAYLELSENTTGRS
jgi:hypothetical protein